MSTWHTHVFTSTYTADVSGVCSIMYELGGMTVLHDPSGCNSTYSTHDEPRWFNSDSLMFISALDEMTAILGDDSVIVRNVKEAADALKPRFITLCGASIPHIIAFDYKGVAHMIEQETGIPVLPVATNGLYSYVSGAGLAAREWIRRFADEKRETIPHSVNLLGVTPIDFSTQSHVEMMKQSFEEMGFTVNGCFAMGDSFEELTGLYAGAVNVAVSEAGILPAQFMKKRRGIPYVEGVPSGRHMAQVLQERILRAENGESGEVSPAPAKQADILVIGEKVFAASLCEAVNASEFARDSGYSCGMLCPDMVEGINEDILAERIGAAKIVIADPLYANMVRDPDKKLISMPHEGYSGRIFRDSFRPYAHAGFDINKLLGGEE